MIPHSPSQTSSIDEEEVDDTLADSFPASDPPPWTTMHAGTPKKKAKKEPDPKEPERAAKEKAPARH